ncbi:Sporangia induced dynein regulatory complex protein, partial [Globisporangium splendens]
MDDQFSRKETQLQEILAAANLDPSQARRVTDALDHLLHDKNARIQNLQYSVAKAFNDTLRTFTEKLTSFGVPEEEIRSLGFKAPTTNVNVNPAGLVAME